MPMETVFLFTHTFPSDSLSVFFNCSSFQFRQKFAGVLHCFFSSKMHQQGRAIWLKKQINNTLLSAWDALCDG